MIPRFQLHQKEGVRELAPGVTLDAIQPGGARGPQDQTRGPLRGGQVWTDGFPVGTPDDDFMMLIPDVRMPPNQYFPLHLHGCWIAVIVLDGECLVGDWWMEKGDVLISAADVEYGPLVNGTEGCQMFEIFAQVDKSVGGYAPEYEDHPTLVGIPKIIVERSDLNKRNEGRMCLPIAEAEGKELWTGKLTPGKVWDLGEANDPNRGAFTTTQMKPGETRAPHSYRDAHTIFVLEGEGEVDGEKLANQAVLSAARDARVGEIKAGAQGMTLLEVARTIGGLEPQFA